MENEAATDDFVRALPGASVIMLELICARGDALPDGRNSNHLAAKALMHGLKQYAAAQGYGLCVAKAENVRSRAFLARRGYSVIFQRGAQAAMQASTDEITV